MRETRKKPPIWQFPLRQYRGWLRKPFRPRNEIMVEAIPFVGIYVGETNVIPLGFLFRCAFFLPFAPIDKTWDLGAPGVRRMHRAIQVAWIASHGRILFHQLDGFFRGRSTSDSLHLSHRSQVMADTFPAFVVLRAGGGRGSPGFIPASRGLCGETFTQQCRTLRLGREGEGWGAEFL